MLKIIAIGAAVLVAGCVTTMSEEQKRAAAIREEVRYHVTNPCHFTTARLIRDDPGSQWFGADIGVIQRAIRSSYTDRLTRKIEANVIRAVWSLDDPAARQRIYAFQRDLCREAAIEAIGR